MTFGRASWQLALSCSLGLPSLVDYALAHGASRYYIGGFQGHCTQEVLYLSVLVAMSSSMSDAILRMTMEDDRIPIMLPAIEASMDNSLRSLSAVPLRTWNCVAALAGQPGTKLKSEAISSATTTARYIRAHLRRAREGAWDLLQGSRRENLEPLARGPPPDGDEVLQNIYGIMTVGLGIDLTMQGLDLMDEGEENVGHEQGAARQVCAS